MHIVEHRDGFDLVLGERVILRHRPEAPALFIGTGDPLIEMHRGHFEIEDRVSERIALRHAHVAEDRIALSSANGQPPALTVVVEPDAIRFEGADPAINRLWLRVQADPGEHLWGGGEQMSYFDLKGRRFPLWTQEPGVGRDMSTAVTWQASQDHRGGDYWTTYYPQPTYLSSRRYALHLTTTAYSVFDFRHADHHEIEAWAVPDRIELFGGETFAEIVGKLADRFGRQPQLPDWVLDGAILGLKDGEAGFARLDKVIAAGAAISGLWCEDWVGLRVTAFGRRLFWDWKANETRYPNLRQKIAALKDTGVRFLGYVNPYLAIDGTLFGPAKAAGYLVGRQDSDEPYIVDFGEFHCGLVDFTNPAACDWFAETVIGVNMLDYGLSGWMADFSEYLPIDVRLASGEDGITAHNAWPVHWARVNAQAVAARGRTGEIVWFMRAGYSGVQGYCPLLWAGDQSVDFTRHDGLPTVICAALSSGLLGNAYHHSDIGGYTSLYGNVRTPETLMRWAEMAAFTAVMRSHEGNRPLENLQIDQDPEVLSHFARTTRWYRHLKPYIRALSREAEASGLPLQRPLFLHFEDDPATYAIQTAYLFGPDLLVAPVLAEGARGRPVYLPKGADWIDVWTGARYAGGAEIDVDAPLGRPPVFYRRGSPHQRLFDGLKSL